MSTDDAVAAVPRRQRGTDRDTTPQPALHAIPSPARIARARLAVTITAVVWALYLLTVVVTLSRGGAVTDAGQLLATLIFLVSVTLLTLSAGLYLLARAGALPRFAAHRRARRVDLDARFAGEEVTLTALLPSRSEDPDLVRMSLWSVALQEFPRLRVVLLLDDDPAPTRSADREMLRRSRALTEELMAELAPIRERTAAAAAALAAATTSADAMEIVMREHAAAARWLRAKADAAATRTHVEKFFADQVLRALASDLEATASALMDAAENDAEPLPHARAAQVMDRLVRIFRVDATTFERKRYASLSHTPNKAMNLNSYLGLIGGRYRETAVAGGLTLERYDGPADDGVLEIPPTDYVLTLDADSMLLPEYCLRLVDNLEQPENARVAVAQTPYSAYRGAPTRLERLAGATTDLQHIVHQGMTAFGATFWVGANAVLRWRALEDIRRETNEDGSIIVRFISDRTVIEDTESSIDIAAHGWTLLNYPERLSYSATPPDFGALVIQRRRWANGGLLILPALRELWLRRRRAGHPPRLAEILLRTNYLGSITWVTLGLLAVLTLYPMDGQLVTLLLLLIAAPYFIEMASDLRAIGYRRRDIVGVYGLNLLLLPVNLAGTAASLAQLFTGRKARFVRTPKVATRTVAPALLVLAPIVLIIGAAVVAVRAGMSQAWGTTAFAAFTAAAALWALCALVGVRAALSDLWFGWLEWIWVEARPASSPAPAHAARWVSVLDDGPLTTSGAVR
ncbi:glycosyltransferase family 2 protein [Microbacterium sp. BG28]|uniref:glycosyltransferase family 2 protein n=1 Tax=Microbacterium sp. BG28 TaxID=3097356 RepID=UPI002A5AB2F9|nr:glycosyltransferase family 2 protein [Microbacterium sp. BG28]MDY0830004.1 glycosyltransferase family 2 protein [Microbacterium sp. BG28]